MTLRHSSVVGHSAEVELHEDTWHNGGCFLRAMELQYNELLHSAEVHMLKQYKSEHGK